jgi:DNA repair protein RadC
MLWPPKILKAAKDYAPDHILGDDTMLLPLCRRRGWQSRTGGRRAGPAYHSRELLCRLDGAALLGPHRLSAPADRHVEPSGLLDPSLEEQPVVATMDFGMRASDSDDPSSLHRAGRDPSGHLPRAQGSVGDTNAIVHGTRHRIGRPLSTLLQADRSGKASLAPYFARQMALLAYEQFRTLYLDPTGKWVLDEKIWSGKETEVDVPFPQIFRSAVSLDAGLLIFVHNHPSGDPRPSRQDVELTRKLSGICKQLETPLYDHLIIARDQSFSFLEHRLL